MPGLTTIVFFALTTFLLTVSPGPGVLYVTSRSLSQGRRVGFVSMFAIESGEVVWLVAAATGIAALLSASVSALTLLRFAGAASLHNLLECGFTGAVYPVNPSARSVHSLPCYPSLTDDDALSFSVVWLVVDAAARD